MHNSKVGWERPVLGLEEERYVQRSGKARWRLRLVRKTLTSREGERYMHEDLARSIKSYWPGTTCSYSKWPRHEVLRIKWSRCEGHRTGSVQRLHERKDEKGSIQYQKLKSQGRAPWICALGSLRSDERSVLLGSRYFVSFIDEYTKTTFFPVIKDKSKEYEMVVK